MPMTRCFASNQRILRPRAGCIDRGCDLREYCVLTPAGEQAAQSAVDEREGRRKARRERRFRQCPS